MTISSTSIHITLGYRRGRPATFAAAAAGSVFGILGSWGVAAIGIRAGRRARRSDARA